MPRGQWNATDAVLFCAHPQAAKHDSQRAALLEERFSANFIQFDLYIR